MVELFDTHCHLSDTDFDQDRSAVLARMAEMGVTRCAVIGYDLSSSETARRFAQETDGVCCAVGVHPEHADTLTPDVLDALRKLAAFPEVRAIGEIGMDLHWDTNPSAEVQKKACIEQMELAHALSLPVSLRSYPRESP